MANSYFTIPDTGTIVYNGDTVMLAEYPGILAIAVYGWYRHNQSSKMGWHFVLLPNKEVVPAGDVNLSLLTVVSSEHGCPSPSPCPPIPVPAIRIEDRTFITLDSIAQRDKLLTTFMPNGRIVRVNDTGAGEVGYFQWNVMTQTWEPWDISTSGATNCLRVVYKDIVNSVDALEYTNNYIKYTFHAGLPLCEALGVPENSLCELYCNELHQVVTVTSTQETLVRQVYQIEPTWFAGDWMPSTLQQNIADITSRVEELEAAVETWKANDQLENVLTGYPRLSDEELNTLLEARLNGIIPTTSVEDASGDA